MKLEPLESRVAPAFIIAANGLSAKFTDEDGDLATLRISAGDLHHATIATTPAGAGEQLALLDVSAAEFNRTNVTLAAVKKPGGDGLVNVGFISAAGRDLGVVNIAGDLGAIVCGDGATDSGFGLKSLTVRTLGRFGAATGAPVNGDGTPESHVTGAVGSLAVKGDMAGVLFRAAGNGAGDELHGTIGGVAIGGSLLGGATKDSGALASSGAIGAVKIGHDVQGGSGVQSGRIFAGSSLKSVSIHGSLIGGSADQTGSINGNTGLGPVTIGGSVRGAAGSFSASILSLDIASVKIGGDLRGGAGALSGLINSNQTLGPVTIGGSVIGGSGINAGIIFGVTVKTVKIGGDVVGGQKDTTGGVQANNDIASVTIGGSLIGGASGSTGFIRATSGNLGAIKIGHDVIGGGIAGTQPGFSDSGEIQAGGRIASVAIGGSIVAGLDDSTGGDLFRNATILARDDIGSVSVKGSLLGRESANGATPVIISARGQDAASASLTATSDLAIGKISIGGRVENARILAGYDYQIPGAGNGNAQIGPVKVGGDWVGSSIVAGVKDTNSDGFGNSDDSILGAVANSIAKIATITIGGTVFGTPGGGDHFGFVSHAIGKFKAGAFTAALHAGAGPDVIALSLLTGDTTLREIVL